MSRLREIRKSRNLTQLQLAELVGMTQGQIGHYELGRIRLNERVLVRLAEALQVTPGDIIGGAPETAPVRHIPIIGTVPGLLPSPALTERGRSMSPRPEARAVPYPTDRHDLVAYEVQGHAMSAIAPHGSAVIVDPRDTSPAALHGALVVVESAGELALRIWDNERRQLCVYPAGGAVEPERSPLSVRFLGRVVAQHNDFAGVDFFSLPPK